MRVELTLNKAKMDKTNEYIRKSNAQSSEFLQLPEVSGLEDFFKPYTVVQAEIENRCVVLAKDYRLSEEFYGIYGCDGCSHYTIGCLTDYEEVENCESPLYWQNYGVADNASQVLDYYDTLYKEHEEYMKDKKFVILMSPVFKNEQSKDGGWRWHKWGPYIGVHEQCCEYLYDEQGIDYVYCFNIVEVRKSDDISDPLTVGLLKTI